MNLGDEDVLRLQNATYERLAETARAWFIHLTRDLLRIGLVVSLAGVCSCCA